MAEETRKEQNFVSDDLNWRAHIRTEIEVARAFQENWGYLKVTPEELQAAQRHCETRKVKYYTGDKWTVVPKRIPNTERAREVAEPHIDRFSATREKAAMMAETKRTTPFFRTTNCEYGTIGNLEMFGVADFGLKGSLSKLPPYGDPKG